ncbi:EscS/YscS/HrcS family type III secretion system export apparatus protein [Pseudomonas soli]|jgi:type III secretion protein S|uniref:Type III secretion protein S n=1 Tax=Pseudomonas soli TaxID=1306993 RepID=A0A1H9KX66_9PSED|nr:MULTISPECIES: type III secretion system export apparatus subunit SctS [Pseudomonas]AIN59252.1 preprotein translocase S [Pseudomonas soli]AUY36700.1 EscS/YscS/HrcS family type III secretion system export apparatus protein [Pseudomonas sp. PONIH3]MBI6951520.1 type III secretion system export apparatus subunit SctS [Pseudomonas sp. CCOS 191]MCX5507035.1 type III secretion system export apparatus subunit SctS [Pseudomonas sp. BJa3]MDT3714982.1 type III secretion system export apparatus subunit 
MSSTEVLHFASQALWLILILSLPTVLMAALVGTLVSLVQALTQVQEQTLGFVAKLVAVVVTLFVTADWMGSELYRYTDLVLERVLWVR